MKYFMLLVIFFTIIGFSSREGTDLNREIDEMTLEEKIGQMFIIGFHGTEVDGHLEKMLKENHVGGVILFSRNISNLEQLFSLTNGIKKENNDGIPLFISIDEEGGRVSRLPATATKFPPNEVIGKLENKQLSYEVGSIIGRELSALGFNMNFAPVLDIYSNPDNEVIGDRAFGDNPKIVSELGISTMEGLADQSIIPVVKHFPGHGDTEVDSHYGLPQVNHTLDHLKNFELRPFQQAIQHGADAVMTAHITFPNVDDTQLPATLSKVMINDVLREKMGFDGVVITDDIVMEAIAANFSVEEAVYKGIQAGIDIFLISSDVEAQQQAMDELLRMVHDGEIQEERIDESVKRILQVKNKYSLTSNPKSINELDKVGVASWEKMKSR
ncbi:beta-N-acetylhexosaminidase [Evansella cellulosilytica]|uniref:beta-N-acetylhexosaminidase n=1 Tax=Evansella cellulosilytica (strain ATCC 21833 / DSM 2522 / FERM P-1141 / JCM 9156 / N-4) TaxID=649639 RepID=E6TTW8_EVAC2|nr:beta-N-acetylhexosaminidase [Evansella cellulosilytica]ADU31999.1 glycoside hydrolase family 3 domain protein [Evansella cellulosilytica DSM 2522]